MKIYFAASIRGGRDDAKIYKGIIDYLRARHTVLTEHFGNQDINAHTGTGGDSENIYRKDVEWIVEADMIVAEVTQPSLGVGYEIATAEKLGKKIVCLFRETGERTLSAMISGNPYPKLTIIYYRLTDDLFAKLAEAL